MDALRILAIEDNPADFRLLTEYLREAPSSRFEAVGAGTLKEGLERLSESAFDAVLLDLDLPDSSGLQVLESVVAAKPSAPVIVLTGLADEAVGLQALSKGAQDYLVKGRITGDALIRCVRYSIERKKTEEAARQMTLELTKRAAAIERANEALQASRVAALNLMEDAIEARKRAEQASEELRKAKDELEERVKERTAQVVEQARVLDAFFELSLTPFCVLDRDFNFIRVNQAYAKACRRNVFDFPGHNHFVFYPHEENQRIFAEVVRTKKPHVAVAKPFSYPDHPEWGVSYWDWTLTPLIGGDGEVERLFFSLDDVTESKKAEEALRLASAYNRSLIESSLDPMVTIGADGTITDANTATEAATGRSRQDLIGTDFSDYFTEPAKARAGYEQVFREGFIRDYPLELRHRDGRITSVLYNASLYRDAAGQALGVFAAARDITELKRAQLALEQNERLLRTVLGSLPVGVWIIDRAGTIILGNNAAKSIWGVPPHVGPEDYGEFKGWRMDTHKPIKRQEWAGARAVSRGETSLNEEFEIEAFDGPHKILLSSALPIRNDQQEILGAVVVEQDITQRRRLEQERQLLADKVLVLQEEERRSLSSMLHDHVGQLLTLSRLDLEKLHVKDARSKQIVHDVLGWLGDVLSAVRNVASSLRPPLLDDMDVETALDTLVHEFAKNAKMKSTFEHKDRLPTLDSERKTCLYRVLQEALTNAAKHGRASRVDVALGASDNRIWLEVRDNGEGFDPGAKTRRTGIGLVGMRERVRRYGGNFEIRSAPGQGTIVRAEISMTGESPAETHHD